MAPGEVSPLHEGSDGVLLLLPQRLASARRTAGSAAAPSKRPPRISHSRRPPRLCRTLLALALSMVSSVWTSSWASVFWPFSQRGAPQEKGGRKGQWGGVGTYPLLPPMWSPLPGGPPPEALAGPVHGSLSLQLLPSSSGPRSAASLALLSPSVPSTLSQERVPLQATALELS